MVIVHIVTIRTGKHARGLDVPFTCNAHHWPHYLALIEHHQLDQMIAFRYETKMFARGTWVLHTCQTCRTCVNPLLCRYLGDGDNRSAFNRIFYRKRTCDLLGSAENSHFAISGWALAPEPQVTPLGRLCLGGWSNHSRYNSVKQDSHLHMSDLAIR